MNCSYFDNNLNCQYLLFQLLLFSYLLLLLLFLFFIIYYSNCYYFDKKINFHIYYFVTIFYYSNCSYRVFFRNDHFLSKRWRIVAVFARLEAERHAQTAVVFVEIAFFRLVFGQRRCVSVVVQREKVRKPVNFEKTVIFNANYQVECVVWTVFNRFVFCWFLVFILLVVPLNFLFFPKSDLPAVVCCI